MFQRTSKVQTITTKSIIFSSALQVGDCRYIDSTTNALATQRRSEIIYDREDQFNNYKIFFKPATFPLINESLQITFQNPYPFIAVENINILGISTSSIANIGNVDHVRMQSRIKHIRDARRIPST